MSLQIPIQKDIGEYEEKIVGKLSDRKSTRLNSSHWS